MRRLERAQAAACGQLLHVGQLALVHPFPDQPRVHAVEPEDDELLVKRFGRAMAAAREGERETDRAQDQAEASHGCRGRGIIAPAVHWFV